MYRNILKKFVAASAAAMVMLSSAYAGEVEVLHWWTSGGEAKSVAELKKLLEAEGHTWKDFAVAGGAGENAMTVLKTRVVSGNPPTAAQVKGPAIQEWGDEGVLADLNELAKSNKWDSLLPGVVSDVMKYKGAYVAVPVNVHRVNWMWANKAIFDKVKVKAPTTWKEFEAVADKIKKAGYMPVAHGGQPWQDATVFESILLGVGGSKVYNDAFVKLDEKALGGKDMLESFRIFRKYQSYADEGNSGRDWNLATAMVIEGKAAMQFMGDWAKGEFLAAGKVPGKDFICAEVPGTSNKYTFNVDSFIMFKQSNADANKAQNAMARLIMEPQFQEVFNLNKGSIPVRTGMKMDKFDSCGQSSAKSFVSTAKSGDLVPSMAHGMSLKSDAQGAVYDVITKFFNSKQTPEEGVKAMVDAVKAVR